MAVKSVLNISIEDRQCKPLKGVSVHLNSEQHDDSIQVKAKPGIPGQYELSDLQPGRYKLNLSKRGHETDSYDIDIPQGFSSQLFVLGQSGDHYFFAGGRKVYYEPVHNQFLIDVAGHGSPTVTTEILNQRGLKTRSALRHTDTQDDDGCFECVDFPDGLSEEQAVDLIDSLNLDLSARNLSMRSARVIRRGDVVQGLTNEICVQFKPDVIPERAAQIANSVGLTIKRQVLSSDNAYLLATDRVASYDLLRVANELHETHREINFAEPDLLVELETDQYTPNDTLYNLQNHLPLINCDDAWENLGDYDNDLRGGSPEICIAVFDPGGVAPNHPDLIANLSNGSSKLVTSFNFRNMSTQTVAQLGSDHGTQCAGTATAAFDNNRGIAGVAPNCRLIGARIPSPATGTQMADAFLWSAGINNGNTTPGFPALPAQPADVISNSWGSSNQPLSSALQNAFDQLTDDGRNGRGCVVTFSTGNLGFVQFSNIRTFAAYNRTIAVGASINSNPTSPVNSSQADPNGNTNNIAVTVDTRTLFNPFGPEMDIVAPSHTCYPPGGGLTDPTTTTVRVGTGALDGCPGGGVCNDYATSFGGTSHSSPTIAGTAALILSANPFLSWDEVRAILRRTSVRIDAGNANASGQYVDNDGDGIAEFSQWYGYGKVDVAQAVSEALGLYIAMRHQLLAIRAV